MWGKQYSYLRYMSIQSLSYKNFKNRQSVGAHCDSHLYIYCSFLTIPKHAQRLHWTPRMPTQGISQQMTQAAAMALVCKMWGICQYCRGPSLVPCWLLHHNPFLQKTGEEQDLSPTTKSIQISCGHREHQSVLWSHGSRWEVLRNIWQPVLRTGRRRKWGFENIIKVGVGVSCNNFCQLQSPCQQVTRPN